MKQIKVYTWAIVMTILLAFMVIFSRDLGIKAFNLTLSNFVNMFSVLPPIMILIGLLDVWVPKEVMIRLMGEKSGLIGVLIAFLLGSLAAGPLYAAFPIAAILIKKKAHLTYVIFFLGVWSTAKLPMILFEYTSFGGQFTLIHNLSNLIVFFIGAVLIEKTFSKKSKEEIVRLSSEMIQD